MSNTGAPPLTPSVPPGASDSHTAYRRWALDAKIQTAVLPSGSPPTSTSSLGFHPQEAALSSKEGGPPFRVLRQMGRVRGNGRTEKLWSPDRAGDWAGMGGNPRRAGCAFGGSHPEKSCCTFLPDPGWLTQGGKSCSPRSGGFLWEDPLGTDMRAQEAEEEGRELWGEVTALHSDVRTPLAPISESHSPCMPSPAGPP